MEVKLDTNLSGYGGEIIRHLDAMIGRRVLENPYAYCHDRLAYAMSREERQWAGKSPRTLDWIHPETGFLMVSMNQLRVRERLSMRDEGLGSHGGLSAHKGTGPDVRETTARIKGIMEAYVSTYHHFKTAPQYANPEFPPLHHQPSAADVNVPEFFQALRQRIGFLKASEVETAIYRFHAAASSQEGIHEKECLRHTVQLQQHLRQLTAGTALGRDGRLTSYGDTFLELHQALGQSIEYQRHTGHILQQQRQAQYSTPSSGHLPPMRKNFFDR